MNKERLRGLRGAELAMGSTLIGPHRDDVEMTLNNRSAREYASQGEQRTLALAIKLAEPNYLMGRLRRQPIVILDDMLSELDPQRKENLAGALTDSAQCFVSVTSLADWPASVRAVSAHDTQMFDINEGTVSQETTSVR